MTLVLFVHPEECGERGKCLDTSDLKVDSGGCDNADTGRRRGAGELDVVGDNLVDANAQRCREMDRIVGTQRSMRASGQ